MRMYEMWFVIHTLVGDQNKIHILEDLGLEGNSYQQDLQFSIGYVWSKTDLLAIKMRIRKKYMMLKMFWAQSLKKS